MSVPARFRRLRPSVLVVVVLATLAVVGGSCGRSPLRSVAPPVDGPAALVPQAVRDRAWPAAVVRAATIQDRHSDELRAIPGVVGTAISADESGRPVLLVMTERRGVSGVPAAIEGLPTRLYATGRFVAAAKPGPGITVKGGASTFNENECNAGTLGCTVIAGGLKYFLSCNHVFARANNASLGEYIVSPGPADLRCAPSTRIATLADFQILNFDGDNTIDAAIALPLSGVTASCAMTSGYKPSSVTAQAYAGMPVKTTGRTGVIKRGMVIGIHATGSALYSNGQAATFIDQIIVGDGFATNGDSGALVVTDNKSANPVGMVVAASGSGATMCNDIGYVLVRFGAAVCSQ